MIYRIHLGQKVQTIKRKYIRHPALIPIEYKTQKKAKKNMDFIKDIGLGGLSFKSSKSLDIGDIISIKIPIINPEFEFQGSVAWCLKRQGCYEIGVKFVAQKDVHRIRMIEQICYIKLYKEKIVKEEGRFLSDKQAAFEWIDKFSEQFPK